MNEELFDLIRQTCNRATSPEAMIPMRVEDVKDLLDAMAFYRARRGSGPLWVSDDTRIAGDDKPFTERLSRLQSDAKAACEAMLKLFGRVGDPQGQAVLKTQFRHIVNLFEKVADETMAVHREHFQCKPKEPQE